MNYKFWLNSGGKPAQKLLMIGANQAISLKEAREARDAAKFMIAKGKAPKPNTLFESD